MEENNTELKAYFNGFINRTLVFVMLTFGVFICQVVNAQVELGHMEKYYIDFPYNIQPSELDIKGKISQVEYTNYELEYKFGEFQKGSQIGFGTYKYNSNGQLVSLYRKGDGWDGWYVTSVYNWDLHYDSNGNVVFDNYYSYENGKLSKVIYGGNVIRMYYTNGMLNKVIKYWYIGHFAG